MDCLRSFNLNASGVFDTATFTGTDFYRNWIDAYASITGWNLEINPGTGMSFTIQGFKNIDIYGIGANIYMQGNAQTTGTLAVVNDYAIQGTVTGINSSIGGFSGAITSPFILEQNTNFLCSKTVNMVKYNDPIKSSTAITINKIFAEGSAPQSLLNLNINYFIYLTIYYKFDGE